MLYSSVFVLLYSVHRFLTDAVETDLGIIPENLLRYNADLISHPKRDLSDVNVEDDILRSVVSMKMTSSDKV